MCITVVQHISYCGHVCVERCKWSYITRMVCPKRIRKTQLSCMVGFCDVCMERATRNVVIVDRIKAAGETRYTEIRVHEEMTIETRRKRESRERRNEDVRDRETALALLKKAINKMSQQVKKFFDRRKAEERHRTKTEKNQRRSTRVCAKVSIRF
ncbi:hypothetical protein VTN49DRAFT_3011 [Thermomyces lanuginosus]|uniref:uncharacterized protein n=1 Tax=Thermomyces lanuginosus TaxID=5541 RepID=UPI003742E8BE